MAINNEIKATEIIVEIAQNTTTTNNPMEVIAAQKYSNLSRNCCINLFYIIFLRITFKLRYTKKNIVKEFFINY